MKKLKLTVLALLLFAVLAAIGYAFTPPPPPVPQNLGMPDTTINDLVTNATDQSACRVCHQTSGTNISGGYNNTIGGVPTRHHNMLPEGIINPMTNAPFGCQDCHPSIPGIGNGILLDRSCLDCHNGTAFWADTTLGAHVGNFSRPHHVNTSYDDANIGTPAANRTCNFCHGSFVNNYNDGHYKPSYATDFMITPFATFKATNFSQPDGLGGNKTWGGCHACHEAPLPFPYNCYVVTVTCVVIRSNIETHHTGIFGFGGDPMPPTHVDQNATPGAACSWCHVIDSTNSTGRGNTFPLEFNTTNPFTGENLINAMEVRNSTIESIDVFEPGTANITINGTGCEKCHGVSSIHNIQFNYSQNGPQGLGHINNNSDCSGCHDSWLPADTWVPGALIPTLDSVSPSVIAVGVPTTLTITGSNFVNPDGNYTSMVTVDGVTYTPTSLTATQIVVNIPALTAGVHQLQLVKGRDTLSKLWVLTVAPNPTITSASLKKGVLTITGSGFGAMPVTTPQYYVSVKDTSGNQIVSTSVLSWSDTQIKIRNSAAYSGGKVTVLTANSGETIGTIQ